ncbi:MAG: DUF4189 domain-containing protein [Defluviicoccus sp.]|nr:DUF4189 domain-containing protein [Defluviicoccus sp.]MDE0274366.1 DUF4189 domain-containing protein [Defluviicoccus sp.]
MRVKAVFDRRRLSVKLLATLIAAALLPVAAPSHAQDAHGAIAVGRAAQERTVAYGFSWNHAGRDTASKAALGACRAGGGTDCVELAWFQNGCGALVLDRHGMAQGKSARTLEQAEARALQTCEAAGGSGCTVVGSQCASPGGRAGTWTGSERALAKQEGLHGQPAEDGAQRDEGLTRGERVRVQRGLAALGFETGPADGMFGPKTRSAIWQWQEAKGLKATGYLTRDQAAALVATGAAHRIFQGKAYASGGRATRRAVIPSPKCTEVSDGAACWKEVTNKRGCYFRINGPEPDHSATWSGTCTGGIAVGKGTLVWTEGDAVSSEFIGAFVEGRFSGPWLLRYPGWGFGKGPYVEGVMHGEWVWHGSGWGLIRGSYIARGPYVKGKKQGEWVYRYIDYDSVYRGHFVEDRQHGEWIFYRITTGGPKSFYKKTYVHGETVHEYIADDLSERTSDYDEATGVVVSRFKDGSVYKRNIDRRTESYTVRFADGTVSDAFPKDEKSGRWVLRYPDGSICQGPYMGYDEKKHGEWTCHHADGIVHKVTFKEGDKQGTWVIRYPDGTVQE